MTEEIPSEWCKACWLTKRTEYYVDMGQVLCKDCYMQLLRKVIDS